MSDENERAVRRALARDDLLTLAAAADRAVDIVRSREDVARRGRDGRTLFDIALERQLNLARINRRWAIRAQAWDHAAVLVRFCAMVGAKPGTSLTAEELHGKALRELEDHETDFGLDRDMTIGVFNRYHAARNFRLAGDFDAALDLVKRPVTDLFGVGAEPHMAHFLYEVGAAYIQLDRAAEVRRPLLEWEKYWETTRASGYSTRYRFDFIRALAQWAADPSDEDVYRLLSTAVERLQAGRAAAHGPSDGERDEDVRELSVLLATAEYLAAGEHLPERVAEAVRLGVQALDIANCVRARWRVVARSRAPLAEVFGRVYGDLALLARGLPGPAAAELGFRVAVSAKQTGFAVRIRDGQTFNGNPTVNRLLDLIVEMEGSSLDTFNDNRETRKAGLERPRGDLADAVSPMLADTVFPPPADLTDLVKALGPRYALDFVELPDTLDNVPRLFRTLIQPGGRMWFDLCEPAAEFRFFLEQGRLSGDLARRIARGAREVEAEESADGPWMDWRGLAKAVLPERLTGDILADADLPVRLLISAHSWLSLVPWAALTIDDAGTRLVERAVLAQSPVLTCLAGELPPRVTGRALIRLVGKNETGVNVDCERRAWSLGAGTDGVAPHECRLLPGDPPRPYPGRFDQALAEPDVWQFVHVASHGAGKGFDQHLVIPHEGTGEQLSAARALGLKWPTSVLMASCHVGLVVNDNGAEPLSFAMALLTGGARCVVAGIDSVDDEGTGEVAGHIVTAIRDGDVSLEVALRNAQLAAIKEHMTERGWALLSAYVR